MTTLFLELPGGQCVRMTVHLIERWREAVCPLMSLAAAARHLDRWLELTAEVLEEPPAWVTLTDEHDSGVFAWVVAGDFAIPIIDQRRRLYAPTILCRGCLPTTIRRDRNHDARADRAIRAARRRRHAAQEARSGDRARRRARLAPEIDHDAG